MPDIAEQYKQRVSSYIEEIKVSGEPVVIFGAGRAGWHIMKVLEYHKVSVTAFSDNDPAKQKTYYNCQVLSPEEIARRFPGGRVFLGLFVPDTARSIKKHFQLLNFRKIHYDTAAFFFVFLVEVAGRICDEEKLARSIQILFENYEEGATHYGYTKKNYFVSPFVTSVITQKCSLRCRDCAQLIPYYENPVHFSAESVIDDLTRYAEAFDVVPEISFHGGEPFLHPYLKDICLQAAAIPNIIFISFVTNGTIMPSEDTLRVLSSCGADVHQSGGYGPLSRKQDALFEAFGRHNIYSDVMFCLPTEMWIQSSPYNKHARPAAINKELYKKCVSGKICCQIMDGELHRCPLSAHGGRQGLVPLNTADFVRLHGSGRSESGLTSDIRAFLTREQAISACDYCDPEGGTLVPPAIQLPR
ncbi:MAG: radical SAM protein [Nitrospirae bacterium]|nr:radical SAM protein [Nitrospirota bacterium]